MTTGRMLHQFTLKDLLTKTIEIMTKWHQRQYIDSLQDKYPLLIAEIITNYLMNHQKELNQLKQLLKDEENKIIIYSLDYNISHIMNGCGGSIFSP